MQVEQILTVTHGSPVYGRGEDTSLLWSRAKGSVRNLQKLGEVSTPAEKAAIQKAGKGYPAFPPSLSQSLLQLHHHSANVALLLPACLCTFAYAVPAWNAILSLASVLIKLQLRCY